MGIATAVWQQIDINKSDPSAFTSADGCSLLPYIDFSAIKRIRSRHCNVRHDSWKTQPHRDPYLVGILFDLAQKSSAAFQVRKEHSVQILAAKSDVEVQALYLYSAVISQTLVEGLKRPHEVRDASISRLNIQYSIIHLFDLQSQMASCLVRKTLAERGLCLGESSLSSMGESEAG